MHKQSFEMHPKINLGYGVQERGCNPITASPSPGTSAPKIKEKKPTRDELWSGLQHDTLCCEVSDLILGQTANPLLPPGNRFCTKRQ